MARTVFDHRTESDIGVVSAAVVAGCKSLREDVQLVSAACSLCALIFSFKPSASRRAAAMRSAMSCWLDILHTKERERRLGWRGREGGVGWMGREENEKRQERDEDAGLSGSGMAFIFRLAERIFFSSTTTTEKATYHELVDYNHLLLHLELSCDDSERRWVRWGWGGG